MCRYWVMSRGKSMVTGKWPAKDESSRKQCSAHRCDDYLRATDIDVA